MYNCAWHNHARYLNAKASSIKACLYKHEHQTYKVLKAKANEHSYIWCCECTIVHDTTMQDTLMLKHQVSMHVCTNTNTKHTKYSKQSNEHSYIWYCEGTIVHDTTMQDTLMLKHQSINACLYKHKHQTYKVLKAKAMSIHTYDVVLVCMCLFNTCIEEKKGIAPLGAKNADHEIRTQDQYT